jgi:hypothetical protein
MERRLYQSALVHKWTDMPFCRKWAGGAMERSDDQ